MPASPRKKQDEFASALREGFDAHHRAEKARSEVDAVLDAASVGVRPVADVELTIAFVERPLSGTVLEAVGLPPHRERVPVILARNSKGVQKALANVRFSETGFPISLSWPSRSVRATDVASFRDAVKALLKDPKIAETIMSVSAG